MGDEEVHRRQLLVQNYVPPIEGLERAYKFLLNGQSNKMSNEKEKKSTFLVRKRLS